MSRNAFLTYLTFFLACAGFSYNAGQLWFWGGTTMACDHAYHAARLWPVLPFVLGVMYGAVAEQWAKEYFWMAAFAAFAIGHALWRVP